MIKKKSAVMIIIGAVLAIYVAFLLFMLITGVFTAFKAQFAYKAVFPENVYEGNEAGAPKGWPWQWQWSNFSVVVDNIEVNKRGVKIHFFDMLGNTLMYTIGGALISTLFPCFVAYVTAKTRFRFSSIYDSIILAVMAIPIVGAYPSELQVLNTMGLYDEWAGYYIQRCHCISVYYFVFQAAFRAIPMSYSEAAYMDGAGRYTVMFKVCMPLVKTIMGTVFLIFFVQIWNDYNTSILYMPSHPSIAYGVFYACIHAAPRAMDHITYKMAASMILFFPTLVLFVSFHKTLMQNLSMGGLKE